MSEVLILLLWIGAGKGSASVFPSRQVSLRETVDARDFLQEGNCGLRGRRPGKGQLFGVLNAGDEFSITYWLSIRLAVASNALNLASFSIALPIFNNLLAFDWLRCGLIWLRFLFKLLILG